MKMIETIGGWIIDCSREIACSFTQYYKRNGEKVRRFKNLTLAGALDFGFVATIPAIIIASVTIVTVVTPKQGTRTKEQFREITKAIIYYIEKDRWFPSSPEVLIQGRPLRSNWLNDEWGNKVEYQVSNDGDTAIIKSVGGLTTLHGLYRFARQYLLAKYFSHDFRPATIKTLYSTD